MIPVSYNDLTQKRPQPMAAGVFLFYIYSWLL